MASVEEATKRQTGLPKSTDTFLRLSEIFVPPTHPCVVYGGSLPEVIIALGAGRDRSSDPFVGMIHMMLLIAGVSSIA